MFGRMSSFVYSSIGHGRLNKEVRCSQSVQRVFDMDVSVAGGSGNGGGVGLGSGGWHGGLVHQGHTPPLTGDGQA